LDKTAFGIGIAFYQTNLSTSEQIAVDLAIIIFYLGLATLNLLIQMGICEKTI
jgi:hypothetical protein